LKRNTPTINRPILSFITFAAAALVLFGMKSEPSAARPLLGTRLDSYRAALISDSLLLTKIVRNRFAPGEGRPQSSVTFTNPRLLVTTPKSDELPLADVEGLSIRTEVRTSRNVTFAPPLLRFDADLHPGTKRILRPGRPTVVAVTERVTLWNAVVVDRQIVNRTTMQHSRPAVILAAPPRNLIEAMAMTGSHKLLAVYSMVATAYTANSAQAYPTGRTATGLPARYGVVAVDPRVIPLGAHLFIEGYGAAIAADTGGAIVGNRIDLCMDSYQRAISWGRQPVRVYVLRNK
jgi:3D (Asp-Asp-Asp) domain-containing protein